MDNPLHSCLGTMAVHTNTDWNIGKDWLRVCHATLLGLPSAFRTASTAPTARRNSITWDFSSSAPKGSNSRV